MMGGMHDRATTLEELVAAALAPGGGHALAEVAAAWDAGSPVGMVLHDHVRGPLLDARARGWDDAELQHVLGRRDPEVGRLVQAGLADDPTALDAWRRSRRLDALAALRTVLLLRALVAVIGEPPGGAASPPAGDVDPTLLDRVRALLAKAESTTFPPEAEALTAKAHELMARHAIDDAVLAAGGRTKGGAVQSRRILVEQPYATAKGQLLAQVARACGCRTVSTFGGAVVVVFGHAGDLDTVDLLHTSLLVQGTTAMLGAGVDAATRTRGFRQSFLLAYAVRVGERLQAATAAAVADARREHGDALLPVLASKAEAVDEAVEEAFPRLRTPRRSRAADRAGWRAGWVAGGRADLAGRSARLDGAKGSLRA